jgi:DNA-binding HxlR family transcriptional regulator
MSEKTIVLLITMSLIGTKEPLILFHLLDGGLRSGLLQKKISGISNKMFTQTVREEKRWPYFQKIFPVVPPKVEYKLSEREEEDRFENILKVCRWGGALQIVY